MKLSLIAIFPVVLAIGFCLGEWRAGNIQENIRKEYEQQHKQEPLPKSTEVDPAITSTIKVFKESHGTHKNCVREVKQIAYILADLLVEHKSFGTCQTDHDTRNAVIDYDKSMDALGKFQNDMLKQRCPEHE